MYIQYFQKTVLKSKKSMWTITSLIANMFISIVFTEPKDRHGRTL